MLDTFGERKKVLNLGAFFILGFSGGFYSKNNGNTLMHIILIVELIMRQYCIRG